MGKSISINGKMLQELRVEQALSLRALGERSGVAYDTINKLELGRRPAHASTNWPMRWAWNPKYS
jgi:transcriptional regulator with XRE-family HTH domain